MSSIFSSQELRACTNFALYLNVFTFALAVQFSMINLGCTPFGVTAYILYHILFRLSSTFSKVFYLFSKFFSNPCGIFLRRPLGQPIYYTTSPPFCQVLFRNFFIFSNSVIVHSLMNLKLCKMHREDSVHFGI